VHSRSSITGDCGNLPIWRADARAVRIYR
jgi:hypothetical protein